MRNRIEIPKGIYGITGDNFSNGRSNYFCVEEMIKGGIKIVQYRAKTKDTREKVKEAREIRELCRKNGVIFIVNDNVDIALLVDADGVHIGQSDIDAVSARKLLGDNKIIGVSARNLQEAKIAKENGADYLGIGAMFSTSTKSDAKLVSFNTLEEIIKEVNLPFVLIGGITLDNVKKLKHFKPDGYALVSGILGTDDISKRVEKWYERI